MCGIAGAVALPGGTPLPLESLGTMLQAIAHRGPDDEGSYIAPDGRLWLGHRRLSILDTTRMGHQPMRHGSNVIVFNGEVYNYRELAAELRQLGHEFHSRTDTEVILHAYEQWGNRCLSRFVGMWAFAIYDEKKRELFCARDPFGIKPFYYSHAPGHFCFASEQKALLTQILQPKVDYGQLACYLVLGISDHNQRTFFEDIRQLSPGCWLTLNMESGTQEYGRYFDLAIEVMNVGERTVDHFAAAFDHSVKLHLRSDVPVGTCLSGGLDSSAVAATASAMYNVERGSERFAAITAGSEDITKDERAYAQQVVEQCDLDWHPFVPSYAEFAKDLKTCLWHQDEPVGGPSVFMQYCVMKQARATGLKVLLDGQGGDELLLGYERYYGAYFSHLIRAGRLHSCAREFYLASRNSRLNIASLALYFGYFSLPCIRTAVLKRRLRWLRHDLFELVRPLVRELAALQADVTQLQIAEVSRFNLPNLLKYEDRNSMAHGVEARVPFVERETVITSLALREEDKMRDGFTKYALRKAMEGRLPHAIVWRRDKVGFEPPTDAWMRAHHNEVSSATRDSAVLSAICATPPMIERLPSSMAWRLYNIALWEDMFGVIA